jgi:hypothetical protein
MFISVLYELHLFHFKVRVISWSSRLELKSLFICKKQLISIRIKKVLHRVSFWILHWNKAHRNQNNIPTLYILEIDSSVFKSDQVSSIFCRFVQKV